MFAHPIFGQPHVGAAPAGSLSRRGFLRGGAIAFGGMTLANLLRREALAASRRMPACEPRQPKSGA